MSGDAQLRGAREDVRSTFQELKRRGPQILVTGEVSETVSREATRRLFGHPSEQRHRILALTDTDVSADRWLPDGVVEFDPDVAVVRAGALRGTTTTSLPATDGAAPACGGDGLATEVDAEVANWLDQTSGPEPAVLRVGLFSLETVLDEEGIETARSLLYRLTGIVRRARGMGHYHLPRVPESQAVEDLRYVFDARLELRETGRRPEQRWHIPGSGTTGWVPLADEP